MSKKREFYQKISKKIETEKLCVISVQNKQENFLKSYYFLFFICQKSNKSEKYEEKLNRKKRKNIFMWRLNLMMLITMKNCVLSNDKLWFCLFAEKVSNESETRKTPTFD